MRSVVSCSKILVALFSSCVIIPTSPVWADDLKSAEKLYAAAAKDMAAGNYARACPAFEAAREKAPEHVRTGMTLAQCYTEWGKPGSAFDELQRVRVFALLQNKPEKVSAIDAQIATLEKSAPLLAIQVPGEVRGQTGLSIVNNGKTVPASQWDARVPVDPGTYRIEATASGKDAWETSVDVKEKGKTVTVVVAPPSWGLTAASSSHGVSDETPPPTARSSKLRTLGFVSLGLGGAGLVAGGILGGLAIKNQNDGGAYCNAQNACTQAGYDLRSNAYTFGNGSTAALLVGSVLLAGGVVLVVIGGKNKESSDKGQTSLWVGPSSVGMYGQW